jgi:hypothetical protein
LLIANHVDFLVIGGYAVAYHGYIRATMDLDLFYRGSQANVARLRRSLGDFGLPVSAEEMTVLAAPGNIIRMGVPPVRIELTNQITGVSFQRAWANRVEGSYGRNRVSFIALDDLLCNKRAAGRPKDLLDVAELGSGDRPPGA